MSKTSPQNKGNNKKEKMKEKILNEMFEMAKKGNLSLKDIEDYETKQAIKVGGIGVLMR